MCKGPCLSGLYYAESVRLFISMISCVQILSFGEYELHPSDGTFLLDATFLLHLDRCSDEVFS